MGCLISCLTPTPGTYSLNPDIYSSWVYVKFTKHRRNQRFYAYNLHTKISLRFPDLPEGLSHFATAVLNQQLYVVGGRDFDGNPSTTVYMCDPVVFKWAKLRSTLTPRQKAVAAAANGRIYVFGGCPLDVPDAAIEWAEVYDPSTSQWTAIQNPSQDLSFSLSLEPVQPVVFRDRIFIRNDLGGIVYNVTSSAWERMPKMIYNYWHKWTSAVEVAGMFVAHHEDRNGEVNLQAYDPDQDQWLPIQYLNPDAFHMAASARRFRILSVNGNLVAYHMDWRRRSLTFTMMHHQMNSSRTELNVRIENTLTYLPKSILRRACSGGQSVSRTRS